MVENELAAEQKLEEPAHQEDWIRRIAGVDDVKAPVRNTRQESSVCQNSAAAYSARIPSAGALDGQWVAIDLDAIDRLAPFLHTPCPPDR